MGEDFPYWLFCLDLVSLFDIDSPHVLIGGYKIAVFDQYGRVTALKTENGHYLPFKDSSSLCSRGSSYGHSIALDHGGLNHRVGLHTKALCNKSLFYRPREFPLVCQKIGGQFFSFRSKSKSVI